MLPSTKSGTSLAKIVYAVMCIFLIARKTMLFGKSPDLADRPDQKGVVFDRWPLLLPSIERRASLKKIVYVFLRLLLIARKTMLSEKLPDLADRPDPTGALSGSKPTNSGHR